MDTRAHLLERALELFAARGYESVGVQEIATTAGVTKPSLYHHFGSKYGLLEALLEQHFSPLLADLELASAYRGDLPLTLFKVARTLLHFAQAHPTFHRLQIALRHAAPESEAQRAIAPVLRRLHHTLAALFASVVADHGNLRGRHDLFAVTFVAMVNAHLVATLDTSTTLDDDAVRLAVKQFMYGIYAL